jgi:hypothetical protein
VQVIGQLGKEAEHAGDVAATYSKVLGDGHRHEDRAVFGDETQAVLRPPV